MGLNVSSLSEVELLKFLTLNLCGFDLGLEAGSRQAIISNLVPLFQGSNVPEPQTHHF